MTTTPAVKICGITDPAALESAAQAGARFVGFVFYPPSPRNISFQTAWTLSQKVPTGIRSVGLFVDPTDETLEEILGGIPLDTIQLHGNETPERVAAIKRRWNMPVIKAFRLRSADDLAAIPAYEPIADWLLFDAAPPGATLPGGTGHCFDWTILKGRSFAKPWMLSGGLTPQNVKDALSLLHPDAVDVSSGVEKAPGVKDPGRIAAFISAVRQTGQ